MNNTRADKLSAITLECHTGAAIRPFIPDAARLRIAVFREWPYLYDGDAGYEREYLLTYSSHPDSLFVVAKSGHEVVGISTGIQRFVFFFFLGGGGFFFFFFFFFCF